MPYAGHVYHVYAVRSARRDELAEALRGRGIAAAVYYPFPIHLQPAYADLGYQAGDLPGAEAAARETLALPIYPELPHTAVEKVADAIRHVVGEWRG